MPISDEPNKILYYTDGTVREFSFNFKFFNTSDIHVSFWTEGEGVYLEENEDYEIEYTDKEGGSVVLLGNRGVNGYPATPYPGTLLISRVMPLDQQANIRPVSGFPEEVITNTFDKLVMIDQQQEEEIQRCLKLPDDSLVSDLTLPEPVANNSLIWDENGTKLVNYDLKGENEAFQEEIVELNRVLEGNINTQFSNFTADITGQITSFENEIEERIETVTEAAEKINQLEEAVTTATNASNVAIEQATIATNQATISTNKANEAINTVSNTLNKTQISNCTLKKSEKINLVFSNGVLTLKAGSEVIVPNGFEGTNKIFNKVIVSSDISLSSPSTTQGTRFVFVTTSNMLLAHFLVDYVYSGNTEKMNTITPKQYILFYNTDMNRIYRGSSNTDGEWYAVSNISIPICKIENDSTATITALKEVYNSVAIMGSTIFADKDIEGLSPNGRNVDGTLNSTQIKTNKVLLTTITSGTSGKPQGLVVTNNAITHRAYFEQEQAPSVVSRWYNPQTNYMYTNSSSAIDTWIQDQSILIGYVTIKDGVYTSLKINNSFRAADYYEVNAKLDEVSNRVDEVSNQVDEVSNRVENKVDKVQVISALMPDWNTAVSKTFTAGELYEVPYDCVLVMSVTSSSSRHLFLRLNGSDGIPIYSAYVDSAGLSRTIVDMIYLEKGTILWADVAQSGVTQDNYIVALKGVA